MNKNRRLSYLIEIDRTNRRIKRNLYRAPNYYNMDGYQLDSIYNRLIDKGYLSKGMECTAYTEVSLTRKAIKLLNYMYDKPRYSKYFSIYK